MARVMSNDPAKKLECCYVLHAHVRSIPRGTARRMRGSRRYTWLQKPKKATNDAWSAVRRAWYGDRISSATSCERRLLCRDPALCRPASGARKTSPNGHQARGRGRAVAGGVVQDEAPELLEVSLGVTSEKGRMSTRALCDLVMCQSRSTLGRRSGEPAKVIAICALGMPSVVQTSGPEMI